jgi:hypothetical protein
MMGRQAGPDQVEEAGPDPLGAQAAGRPVPPVIKLITPRMTRAAASFRSVLVHRGQAAHRRGEDSAVFGSQRTGLLVVILVEEPHLVARGQSFQAQVRENPSVRELVAGRSVYLAQADFRAH